MTQNQNLIRQQNLNRLETFMFEKGSAIKAEMAKETGLSVVTINALVKQLVEANILLEGEAVQQPLGRPALNYAFNYDLQHDLLLSIQEEKTADNRKLILFGQIVNLKGTVKYEAKRPFNKVDLNELLTHVQHFLKQAENLAQIGLSLPGKIYQGVVVSSWGNLFDGWNIEAALATLTDIPVRIQNDAHLMTIGYSRLHHLSLDNTVVGIFYPENSMPGISIFSQGTLVEGRHNLAGEAKYLPHLIDAQPPADEQAMTESVLEILAIYNAVIAPDAFVVSAGPLSRLPIEKSLLPHQINIPAIYFVEDFQASVTMGLRWLVMQESPWKMIL